MNFSTADKVNSCIDNMRSAEINRSANRALLDEFFNGAPLWTEKEAEENRILVNFNDKSGAVLLHTARAQYENALLNQSQFFKVSIPDAPADKQAAWSAFITRGINKPLMDSPMFYQTQRSVFGAVTLHGCGAKVWWDDYGWRPRFCGVQDLLIPTDTELTMENLQYLAIRRKMRPGELFRKTFGKQDKNRSRGWNMKAVKMILDEYKDLNQNPQNYDWANSPEQMTELYKQNQNYYDSDSAPVIWMWDFFHKEEETDNPGWYRKLVLDSNSCPQTLAQMNASDPNPFIFQSKKPFASDLGNIIHFQFGDGNNVPPFMFHSIRSLAFLTYELLWTMNRLRCQWTQHVFEQMLTLFRITDPNDRSRLEQVVFDSPWGIIPEGLVMVPAEERYQVNAALVQGLKQEYGDLVGRASASYTQQVDHGSNKERTKFEVQAMLQQVSALMASLLSLAYRQEHYSYREICRRFCNKKSDDFEIKKFRQKCIVDGKIPEKYLDLDRWDIEIDQKLGGGNRMMELAEASQLMDKVNLFDPSAQAEIKHDYALAVTNNPKKAARLAPMNSNPQDSEAVQNAEFAFAALMGGTPVTIKEGLSHIVQVETLLKLMAGVIQHINQTGGVGDPKQIMGLHMVAIYIQQHLSLIAQDPNEKARVKQYGDALGKMMNQVKAFEQRQQEMAEHQNGNGGGMPPEIAGKVGAKIIEAQAKSKIQKDLAAQKLRHSQEKFEASEKRKNLQTVAQIQRDGAKALGETKHAAMRPPEPFEE